MCVNCGNDCGGSCKITVVTKQGVQGPQGPPFVPGGTVDQYVAGDGSVQNFPNSQNPAPQQPENQFFARTVTRSALNPNAYYNGPLDDGVGSTITFNSVGLIKEQLYNAGYIGGSTVQVEVGDIILVMLETNKKKHGAYVVSVNSLTEQCVLTRLAGYDETSEINSSQVTIYDGEEAGRIFVQQTENPSIGTDNIIYKVSTNINSIPFLCIKVDNVIIDPLPSFTYFPGTSRPPQPGVGARIKIDSVGIFPTLNGVIPYVGMRFLINGESGVNQNYQGDYILTNIGSATSRAIAVRSYSATFAQSRYQYVDFLVNSPDCDFFGKRFTLQNTTPILDINIGSVPLIYVENNLNEANTLQEVSDAGGLDNGSTLKKGSKDNYSFGGGISQVCTADKELQWENGVQYYFPVGQPIVWANSINGDTPDVSYDNTKGFAIGSTYNDLVNNKSYKCTDSTSDNAIWVQLPNLSDLVPYTGATNDVNLGENSLSTEKVFLFDGVNNNFGSIHFTDGNFHVEDADGHSLFVIEDGFMQLHKTNTIQSNLYTSGLTVTRDHYLPDTSGTIALTSNIPVIDSIPTDGSSNTVSSNGVFDALATKEPSITAGTIAQYWRGDKSWQPFPSLGLTVGSTAIASGTIGRLIFQGVGNVIQQDSNLFWDNTNKRLGIGAAPNSSTLLDLRAQGALLSDIAFRVRNSADTTNIVDVRGDGTMNFTSASGAITFNEGSAAGVGQGIIFKRDLSQATFTIGNGTNASLTITSSGTNINSSTSSIVLNGGTSGGSFFQSVDLKGNGNLSVRVNNSGQCAFTASASWYNGDGGYTYTDRVIVDRQSMAFRNATTAPTTTLDSFKLFSKDVAGSAVPHFLTESGNEIKLYRETTAVASSVFTIGVGIAVTDTSTFDGYTIGQITKALRNLGILA